MSEQKLQAKILNLLNRRRAYTVKVISASKSGVPDILCCYKGVFIGLEVKFGHNKLSKLQEANLKAIQDSSGFSSVVYSILDVQNLLEKVDKFITTTKEN